jgi:hypothetical protein
MRRFLGFSRRALLSVAAAAFVSACLSPTLPLPPPSDPDVSKVGEGRYRLQGTVPVSGTVLARNTQTNLVYGQLVETRYDFVVVAEPGDDMVLWLDDGTGGTSDLVDFTIPGAPADGGAPTDGGTDAAPDGTR